MGKLLKVLLLDVIITAIVEARIHFRNNSVVVVQGNEEGTGRTIPGIALLTKDRAFAEGFTRHFSGQYRIHHMDSMNSIQVVVPLKDIAMVVADCEALSEDDYLLYNRLCEMPAFQKLSLIVITQDSYVVNLAKAEIMHPSAVMDKTMSINKISQILEDAMAHIGGNISHAPVVIDVPNSRDSESKGILSNITDSVGMSLNWD